MNPVGPARVVTDRLVLRRFVPTDAERYAAIRSKPEVIRHLPGGEALASESAKVSRDLLARFERQWETYGFGPWAVEDRTSAVLLGHCGLLFVPQFDAVEILFLIDSSYWNRGYATEAALATLQVAFETLSLPALIAMADVENLASRRVLEKTGFRFLRNDGYRGLAVAYYELDNPHGRQSHNRGQER